MLKNLFHLFRPIVAAAALASAFWSPAQAAPIVGQGTWQTDLHARDIDHDGVADAYYDSALDITWLAATSPLGSAGWDETNAWIGAYSIGGFGDWRLPFMPGPANGSTWNYEFSWNGDTDNGYNNTRTEMGHLFYVTLGNLAPCAVGSDANIPFDCIDQWPNGRPEMNTGPFSGLTWDDSYWTATPIGYGVMDGNGYQIACVDCDNTVSLGADFMVVRSGDVLPSLVPEPGTLALAVAGCGLIGWVRRRHHRPALWSSIGR